MIIKLQEANRKSKDRNHALACKRGCQSEHGEKETKESNLRCS